MTMLLVVGAMVFVAGLIRGFTGFGFSVAAVPLLSLVMPPARAVPIVLLLQLAVSLGGLRTALTLCDWRSIRLLALGAAVATPAGVWGLALLPAPPVRLGIAVIVGMAVAALGGGLRMTRTLGPAGVIGFGLLSGAFNGLAGIPGPPVIAFYLAAPLSTGVARASMIVFFLATSVFALVPLASLGMLSWPIASSAATGLPAVWLGSWLGAQLYRHSPERLYRSVALVLLVVTALLAAIRAIADFAAA
jgi:uncharacterized membrane protein YfcA